METMHLAARLLIQQNMQHMTAFSARPGAPVLPVRARRPSRLRTVSARIRGTRTTTRSSVRPAAHAVR